MLPLPSILAAADLSMVCWLLMLGMGGCIGVIVAYERGIRRVAAASDYWMCRALDAESELRSRRALSQPREGCRN